MTREEKIKKLTEEYNSEQSGKLYSYGEEYPDHFKAGILAGIALRDEELLEKLGTFDSSIIDNTFSEDHWKPIAFHWAKEGAKAQHEQFMKAIKGDGDEV